MITSESASDLRRLMIEMASAAPMSAAMLGNLADDIENHGPIARLIADHPHAGSYLYGVRALSGVRLLVLTGRAPELADHLGALTARMWDPAFHRQTWELFRSTLLDHPDDMMSAMGRPVQQHHPSRARNLLTGLAMLATPRVRLIELGACAGLNLLVDRYRWFGDGWEWGDQDSPVRLVTSGRRPGAIEIIERGGCDLCPRDPADPHDAMILRSFVPAECEIDQMDLDDALALAARSQVRVDRAGAVEWLAGKLAEDVPDSSVYTVVWHSLFWPFLNSDDQVAIEKMLMLAARDTRVARIAYEPYGSMIAPRLQVSLYS